ncbi:MAG: hypothetical protein AB7O62_19300 [Pirellulales bacterium]
MDYELQRCTRHCAATGRELREGEPIYSVLVGRGSKLERLDYAAADWPGPPEGVVGWWKSNIPHREQKQRQTPSEVLLEMLKQFDGVPDQADFRYVLALLLVRRRVLRIEETTQSSADQLTLYSPRDEETFTVQAVLPDEQRARQIQDALSQIMLPQEDTSDPATAEESTASEGK